MSAVLEALEPSARYLDAIEPKLVQQFDLLVGASAGVTRLRELILALAMQGKLVPQDPTDESAAQLVMRLIAERGESTLRRRMSTNTGVHPVGQASDSLPSSWAVASLSAISVKLTDGSHNPPRDAGSGIPMLSSQNVLESGTIDFDSPTRYVSIDDFERENTRTNATPGDVLLTIVASLGRSAVVPVGAPAFVLQRSVAVIRTGLVPSFLAIFLRSPAARAYYDQHAKGTAQKGIYLGKLGELTLPIPPLAEQARIAARVDELMRLCDALEAKGQLEAQQHARLLETLLGTLTDSNTPEELAANWQRAAEHFDLLLDRPEAVDELERVIVRLAVRGLLAPQDTTDEPASELLARIRKEKDELVASGRIRSVGPSSPVTGEEEAFDLPAGWQWARLGHLVLDSEAGWSPACHSTPRRQGRWGVLKVSAVSWGAFDSSANKELPEHLEPRSEYEVREGDFLLSRANTQDLVARSVLVEEAPSKLMISDKIIRLELSQHVSRGFVNLSNNADHTRAYYAANASGTSSSMKNVSREVVLASPIALPPMREQARIVARVAELRRLCADLRQRLAASQATQSRLAEALVESALS
jgi:type I restriction enzyme S subunit